MNQVIELERMVFSFAEDMEDRHEDKLMIVKEQEGDNVQWRPLAKGWEYNLWYSIGERGGLAEAEEIVVLEEGEVKAVKIEDYISIYQQALKNTMPISKALELFTITLNASRKKECSDNYVVSMLEEKYQMTKTHEDSEQYYYTKSIESVDDLANVGIDYSGKEHELKLVFESKVS